MRAKITRFSAAGLAAFGLLLGLFMPAANAATTTPTPTVTQSGLVSNNLNIVNRGRLMKVCKHWDYPAGTRVAKTCRNSLVGLLAKNESSRAALRWKDADAICVPPGYKLVRQTMMRARVGFAWIVVYQNTTRGMRCVKVSPEPRPWLGTGWTGHFELKRIPSSIV